MTSRIQTLIDYQFKYPDGHIMQSGGNAGLQIVGEVNHTETKVGQTVIVEQFNLSGSSPSPVVIAQKSTRLWDWSKPMGQRLVSEVVEKL